MTRLAAAATLAALTLVAGSAQTESTVFLTIDSFSRSEAVTGHTPLGFVSGRALAAEGDVPEFDVLFLVDVSGSTAASAGVDVDGDGKIGGGFAGGLRGLFGGSRDTGADPEEPSIRSVFYPRIRISARDSRSARRCPTPWTTPDARCF